MRFADEWWLGEGWGPEVGGGDEMPYHKEGMTPAQAAGT